MKNKKILLITGMHRSGTSLMSRLLNLHGAHLALHSAYQDEFNASGYWESFEVQNANNELLRLGDSSWFDARRYSLPFRSNEKMDQIKELLEDTVKKIVESKNQIIVLKDPRICRMVPIWRAALESKEASVLAVFPYRNPLEVAASLKHRDDFTTRHCLSLWLRNVLEAEFDTRKLKRVFCSYEEMLSDWPALIEKIGQRLQISPLLLHSENSAQINAFISSSLKHWSFSNSDLKKYVGADDLVYRAYQLLQQIDKLDDANTQAQFDVIREEFNKKLSIAEEIENRELEIASFEKKLVDMKLQVTKLGDEIKARDAELKARDEKLKVRDEKLKVRDEKLKVRDEMLKARDEMLKARDEMLKARDAELEALRQEFADLNLHFQNTNDGYKAVLNSISWKITWPLRALVKYLLVPPAAAVAAFSLKVVQQSKQLFSSIWKFSGLTKSIKPELLLHEYVPKSTEPPPSNIAIKLIAFYLPQFHQIPENDKWWGEGFTEWVNVKSAKPQFEGHLQPHVPGDLGYYDLTDIAVQQRQVELAKLYGVGGFCFYFYWFAGKRLLEQPVLNYLENIDLDLPFCLCWANENWTRKWDGLHDNILIAQHYSETDDLSFIRYVAKYLKDERYIKVDGKPLLILYRPNLLPSPKDTAKRWRKWCEENGIGEIYLATTQSFDFVDPRTYGFDATIEFPPNLTVPDVITKKIPSLSKDFSGVVYDWNSIAKRSANYVQPNFPLFRTVNPGWDNTARLKNRGAVFYGNTPKRYEDWLVNAALDTVNRVESDSQKLVFVNAWNEWAEGAYLEPDSRHGYAYLQATRNALVRVPGVVRKRKIVLVAHDAHPHGAQNLILHMAKTLKMDFMFEVQMVVLGEGSLLEEYAKYATIHSLANNDPFGEEAKKLALKLFTEGSTSAIANTVVTGHFVATLKNQGFTVISLVHELEGVIRDNELEGHVQSISKNADRIIFPADQVSAGFAKFYSVDKNKEVILPQGMFRKNKYKSKNGIQKARMELRERFDLPENAIIILNVGYVSRRKGIDLFVEIAAEVLKHKPQVYFLWVGHFDPSLQSAILEQISESGFKENIILPGLDFESDIYYAGADIYALTSREDPFPNVVLEALDVGLPVVAFDDAGGFTDLLNRGCGKLVPSFDTKKYAFVILELIDNPQTAEKLGQTGQRITTEEFSFKKYIFDLLEIAQQPIKRVSVIVPNYNYARYLTDRIQSILNQNYPLFEFIILDDASTDQSIDVLRQLTSNIQLDCQFIRNESNSGSPFVQWHRGVEIATGDYIWIAEADDLALPGLLSTVMSAFETPGVVMSYCQSKQIDSKGQVLDETYLDYVADISTEKWLSPYTNDGVSEIEQVLSIKNSIPNVSAVVFKREALLHALQDSIDEITKFRVVGDWVTYLKVLTRGKIAFSPESLNLHRRHETSRTIESFDISLLKEILSVQKNVRETFNLKDSVICKAHEYSQSLYEQFGLASEDVPSIHGHPELGKLDSSI